MRLVGQRGEGPAAGYLLLEETPPATPPADRVGRVYDRRRGVLHPALRLLGIVKFGYWYPFAGTAAEQAEIEREAAALAAPGPGGFAVRGRAAADGRPARVAWRPPGRARRETLGRALDGDARIIVRVEAMAGFREEVAPSPTGGVLVVDLDEPRSSFLAISGFFEPGYDVEGDPPDQPGGEAGLPPGAIP
jgi:hypothetical protein